MGGGTFSASIISTGEASGRLSLHVAKLGLFLAVVGSSKTRLPRSPTFVRAMFEMQVVDAK